MTEGDLVTPDGEQVQHPTETVGPQQYAGEDEVGPDANRRIEIQDGGSKEERWDINKARTVGDAVQRSLYSPNHVSSEGLKGHPAEEQVRSSNEDTFERFYNLDPERFSQMPTAEFIKAAREYSQVERELADAQDKKEKFLQEYGLSQNQKSSETQPTPELEPDLSAASFGIKPAHDAQGQYTS